MQNSYHTDLIYWADLKLDFEKSKGSELLDTINIAVTECKS